jgi:hypothetical protein
LLNVTREYGCIAPLSVQPVGSNLFFLSPRGVDRVEVNAFGTVLPVLLPPSDNQLAYMNQVDLTANANMATAETWNKRYFIAMPARGQAAGAAGVLTNAIVGGPQNNLIMTCNLRYSDQSKDTWGWEGLWNGFTVYGFARLTIAGQGERLTFCDYNGNVNWLSDGWLDYGLNPINTRLLTRRYNGGSMGRKIWGPGRIIWDTYDTDLTVCAVAPGVNRQYPVTLPNYNATGYLQGPNVPVAYNPETQVPAFNTPFRADYTPQQLSELVGNALEQRQNITQPFRLRVDAWGIQIQITNASGSCRIASVMAGGMMGPSGDRLQAG